MKVVSICQPHFIPWVGYFNMIFNSDEFIILDNVQYNRRSWQNRVHIRDNNNLKKKKLLSLSVNDYHQKKNISEIYLNRNNLNDFKNRIEEAYRDAEHFKKIFNLTFDILSNNIDNNLSLINFKLISFFCDYLNIKKNFSLLSDLNLSEKKENLILEILKIKKATLYLANNGSLNYAGKNFFNKNNFDFKTHDYEHPIYIQKKKDKELDFISHLSILDVLFNHDKGAEKIVKDFNISN
ncbi:WbqC family protein [Candidatus Pelagibacter sp.]|nr:WbqC family protein [Candidatus Pelagibacter sp.]|tara:strand:+ start:328 stop:1041 length:714 start_codon:yes stop_codon:yes gene_type:complete